MEDRDDIIEEERCDDKEEFRRFIKIFVCLGDMDVERFFNRVSRS
jgi:hypothetical protein